ncbi:MAG: hypothetical protein ACHQF4_11535 [Sphingobacteriales bacterium]
MACDHKFSNDLLIGYANWEVRTLFIGTFNPSWLCCNNSANWFYGRTSRNEFWCILAKIHQNNSLINGNRAIWIEFCKRNNLAITDIITSLDNANENNATHRDNICNFNDEALGQFTSTKTDIVQILETHSTIKQLCITRQNLSPSWIECFANMFIWIQNHPERDISIKYLRSPSRGARKGVVGNFCDFIANRWVQQGYQIL